MHDTVDRMVGLGEVKMQLVWGWRIVEWMFHEAEDDTSLYDTSERTLLE